MSINILDNFNFQKNDIIVIGCSAGPDSMALFDMILKIKKEYHLKIICAHVNHNVRKQSKEEEEFLRNYCHDKDVFFESMIIEKYGDDNFHNEARNIRYHFFEEVIRKYSANYLMTAHHGDDLIETILMRIVRGSYLEGYSGFHKIVELDDYKIVRPLISYTKKELEEYNAFYKVPYFEDESNSKMKYTRNRYRKNILPFLKVEDSNVHKKFIKFSRDIIDASHYIEKERDKALNHILNRKNNRIKIDQFLEIDSYLQKEILYYIMEDYYQDDLILVNERHIELLNKLVKSNKANMSINLPNEIVAIKCYNEFYLTKEVEELTFYEIEFNDYATLPNKHVIKKINETDENSNNICRLSSKDVSLPLIIRTRKLGDRIQVKGLNGKKKIKDIFIENKIGLKERDLWPVVVDSTDRVVWIPGLKKSKFDKQKDENYDIIMKYC